MKKLLRIFKIGGNVVEDEAILRDFLAGFADIIGTKILVHGGGKWVSEMSRRIGIEVQMIDGRRVTDADTLEVVKMMLAGVANKNVVCLLQGLGCNAIGLTGADGDVVRAVKRPVRNGLDFGLVGDVTTTNAQNINLLLKADFVPVFAAMTHDGAGQMFNTNADTIASAIAAGMTQLYDVDLVYCFELPGVLTDIDENSVIGQIDSNYYKRLKSEGVINKGMLPKLDNAFDALRKGVRTVRICHADQIRHFSSPSSDFGTIIML